MNGKETPMHTEDRSKLLGTTPMARLVPKISIPIMFSMMIQALYNVVDSIFVSRFDPNGLTFSVPDDCPGDRYGHRYQQPDQPPAW